MARKTFTSTEVKQRWIKNNYHRYIVSFRFDCDKELIDFVEQNKEKLGITNIFRDALALLMEKENQ